MAADSGLRARGRCKAHGVVTITIAQGSARDVEAIMPIMTVAFPSDYGEAWSTTQCTGALALSGTALYLAYGPEISPERPCGFAIIRTVLDEAELLLIAVDPLQQRYGIGAKLLDHICQAVQSQGVTSLHVEVRHDNPALSFYSQFDFVKVGERRNYYRRTDGQVGHALTLVRKMALLANKPIE